MTSIECPHCGKAVELVGQKDLAEEYGMGPNHVVAREKRGEFPIPVLHFGNRKEWLKQDIERYIEERERKNVTERVETLQRSLAVLSERERQQVIKLLAADPAKN